MDSKGYFLQERYKLYQWTQRSIAHEERSKWTALVLIGDEEYWHQDSELARRQSIKRTYLAKLLRALGTIDSVRIIAFDFDLRAPIRHRTYLEHPDYEAERQELLAAIETVSRHRISDLEKVLPHEVFQKAREVDRSSAIKLRESLGIQALIIGRVSKLELPNSTV